MGHKFSVIDNLYNNDDYCIQVILCNGEKKIIKKINKKNKFYKIFYKLLLSELEYCESNGVQDECLIPEHIYNLEDETIIRYEYDSFKPLISVIPKDGMKTSVFLKYAIMICDRLFQLHKKDFHGFLNPVNIMVSSSECDVKFHGAIQDINSMDLNKLVQIDIGLMNYISPEETGIFESFIDYKTDLYSLGCVLYKMCVGHAPFEKVHEERVVYNHAIKTPVSPWEINKDIPKSVSDIIMKLLEKKKSNRYETVYGVKRDLEVIRNRFNKKEEVDIELGKFDIPCRLNFTDELFNRKREIGELFDIYNKTLEGGVHGVVIEGDEGYGKSSVTRMFLERVRNNNTIVINIDDNILMKNNDTLIISNTLDQLLFYCLINEEIEIEEIQEYVQRVTKGCINYLKDLIPRIKFFVQDSLETLEDECCCMQKDVKYVQSLIIIRLMEIIREKNGVIVINLDVRNRYKKNLDNMLRRLLLAERMDKMMVIETAKSCNRGIVEQICEELDDHINRYKVVLEDLRIDDIQNMLLKTFNLSDNIIMNVSRIILVKTKGNPFLVKEYILKLYKKKLFYFDYDIHSWKVDIEKVSMVHMNEDLNSFMRDKFEELPRELKSVLKICSCLQGQFDSNTLSHLSGYNKKTVKRIISYLLKNRIFKEKDKNINIESYNSGPSKLKKYSFESESFKEIIFNQIDSNSRKKYFFKAGKYFLKNEEHYNCKWYIINCFMNTDRFPENNELLYRLKELIKSKATINFSSGEYEDALALSEKAVQIAKIIDDEDLNIIGLKGCSLLKLGEFAKMDSFIEEYEQKINDKNIRLKIAIFSIDAHIINGNMNEAENVIYSIIGDFCNLNRVKDKRSFALAINKFLLCFCFNDRSLRKKYESFIEDIEYETVREFFYICALVFSYTNVYKFLFMTFISLALHNVYKYQNKQILKILKKFYKFTKNDMSDVVEIAVFEMFTGCEGDNISLSDTKQNAIYGINSFYFTRENYNYIHKVEKIMTNMILYNDVSYILYALNAQIMYMISRGNRIDGIVQYIQKYDFKLREMNSTVKCGISEIKNHLQSVSNEESMKYPIELEDSLIIKTLKAMNMFFKKEYDDLKVILINDSDIHNFNNIIALLEFGFYRNIIIAENIDRFDKEKKKAAIRLFQENMKAFAKLKKCENKTIKVKYYILRAFHAYMKKKYDEALNLCYEANEMSSLERYSLGMAIINELCGRIFLEKGIKNMAFMYFDESKKLYQSLRIYTNVNSIGRDEREKNKEYKVRIGHKEKSLKYNDIKEIVDELNSLGGEKNYQNIINRIIDINLKSMNAERVVFFQVKDGLIIREGEGTDTGRMNFNKVSLKDCDDIPKTVINFVIKTKKKITINEAKNNQLFYFDKYILKNNIKSLACYPIIAENEISGVIYLENKSLSRAFSFECETLMDMIICHLVVALSNAKQYNEISERKTSLETLVQKKSEEIQLIEQKLIKEIQERMNVEKKLSRSKEKTEYFANLSHEFKTPLNVILSTIQLIELIGNDSKDKKVRDYLKIMKQNCYRLLRLVNNIIDLTKIDEGYLKLDMKYYNIIRIIEDISMSVVAYAQNKEINLVFDTEVEELNIFCDEEKIERIILNILSNAIKFTPQNGDINVNISVEQAYVVISIKDSGIGIHKEVQQRIFGRFEQADKSLSRKQEGSGIGLALTKQLVEMQGGFIDIISEYGKGCEFIVKLPMNTIDYKEIEDSSSEKISANHNFVEKIKIEFSDIYF